MRLNIQFELDRAALTITAAQTIAPDWTWGEQTVVQMTATRSAVLDQVEAAELLEVQTATARAEKNGALETYHRMTVHVIGALKNHFRSNPTALNQVKKLKNRGKNENDILQEGDMLGKTWTALAPTWSPDAEHTLAILETQEETCQDKIDALELRETQWRDALAKAHELAGPLKDMNQAWYNAATRKFGPDTQHGMMIRETVPTTATPSQPPKQPVIIEALALGGGKIHIDYHSVRATRAKALHQGPGEPAYTLVSDRVKGDIFEMEGLAPGLHKFKLIGVNGAGESPESEEVPLQVT